jgi:hypothetical protein
MATTPSSGPSGVQKAYFLTVLLPMRQGQLDQLGAAEREYRNHLLAVECLRGAKGPGVDPLRIAEFCRAWKIPMTLPFIGPVALLRKIGKAVGGWPSQAAIFDPTGAIDQGSKVIAQMAPAQVLTPEERVLVFVYCSGHVVARCSACDISYRYPELAAEMVGGSRTNMCPRC